jgi:hypothetical protein
MARWAKVEPELAAGHPLQGLRGWLRFFSFWIALSAIGGAVLAWRDLQALADAEALARRPDAATEALIGLVTSVVQVVIAVQWFRLWRHFRLGFLGVTVAAGLVAIGFDLWEWYALQALPEAGRTGPAEELAEQVANDVAGIVILCAFLLYMQRSRRFRVTFENRLRRDDPLLAPLGSEPA